MENVNKNNVADADGLCVSPSPSASTPHCVAKVCRLVAEINALFIGRELKIVAPREPGKGI